MLWVFTTTNLRGGVGKTWLSPWLSLVSGVSKEGSDC